MITVYNIGDNVVSENGEFLGQFVQDENNFISKDVAFLKEKLLALGAYTMATNKNDKNDVLYIYGKRKVFVESVGSINQCLVKIDNDLKWREISKNEFDFIDLDY